MASGRCPKDIVVDGFERPVHIYEGELILLSGFRAELENLHRSRPRGLESEAYSLFWNNEVTPLIGVSDERLVPPINGAPQTILIGTWRTHANAQLLVRLGVHESGDALGLALHQQSNTGPGYGGGWFIQARLDQPKPDNSFFSIPFVGHSLSFGALPYILEMNSRFMKTLRGYREIAEGRAPVLIP